MQLPDGTVGDAVGVVIYSTINLLCACLLAWLLWTHNEQLSHVALIAYFTILSIIASLVQQIGTYLTYQDTVRVAFEYRKLHSNDPELAIANGSRGLDLVLYYIQYYCYSVESMLVMFWAGQLAQSIYGLSEKPKYRRFLTRINGYGKIVAALLPLATILSLQAPAVRANFVVFMLFADFPLMLGVGLGSILLIAVLVKYLRSRRTFSKWSQQNYGQSASGTGTGTDTGTGNKAPGTHRTGRETPRSRGGVYDRWLIVRFTFGFVVLGLFELTNVLFQLNGLGNLQRDAASAAPDFSVSTARHTIVFFMPGVTPGLLIFTVFGTTKPFRSRMYSAFVPKRWQKIPDTSADADQQTGAPHGLGTNRNTATRSKLYASADANGSPSPVMFDEGSSVPMKALDSSGRSVYSHSRYSDDRPILPIQNPAYAPGGRPQWRSDAEYVEDV